MCGLAGFMQRHRFDGINAAAVVSDMADRLAHRGPDDSGLWVDNAAGIAMAHRRLSIVDLSAAGHQPMESVSARYVMVFNGEIYNHTDIRRELVGSSLNTDISSPTARAPLAWRGHSDTETLLAAIDAWGVEATLKKCVGMFSLALWDRAERALTLARDRIGEKPLYYGWQGDTLLFASELKALKAHPSFRGEINRDAIALLLRHNYIPAPHSIYRQISKLLPGTYLTFPQGKREGVPTSYWPLDPLLAQVEQPTFQGDEIAAAEALEYHLREAIRIQMVADVPIGAFLSGGIDSSAIVALMQSQSDRPIRTFTIGFHEDSHNEAQHAKLVAAHLGTDHTELYVSSDEARAIIPRLPTIYDEPFSDSSQIPTFLVSHMARQNVTVSLSGDAGDELFGGYNRYVFASKLQKKFSRLPLRLREMLAQAIYSTPPAVLDAISRPLALAIRQLRVGRPSDKLYKGAELLTIANERELYRQLASHWEAPSQVVVGAIEPTTLLDDMIATQTPASSFEQWMMATDLRTYLPDDILVKIDRAAMSVGLETRVPFLDHRVVEFALSLPLQLKIRDSCGKWVLRKVLAKYVPQELTDRPKMGFGVPIDEWLRGPLREWAESLLDRSRLEQEGFFYPLPIRKKWEEHLSGIRNWHYHLWDVLMFQAWLEAE